MFDFDKAAMAKVLKVTSEKMRDKIFQSLEQYMTTMREQLGVLPERRTVIDISSKHAPASSGPRSSPAHGQSLRNGGPARSMSVS